MSDQYISSVADNASTMPRKVHRAPASERLQARRNRFLAHALTGIEPVDRAESPIRSVCRIVRQLVAELLLLSSDRVLRRRQSRRSVVHVRQIAMYVCHVALQLSFVDIGAAFGRDRTTVGYACHVVEDRRDDLAYDDFVATIERIAFAVFGTSGVIDHE